MSTLHEKSPCCRGKIIRFGNRRRQCTNCHRTWRVWQHRRGRSKYRINKKPFLQFLDNGMVSITREAGRRHMHESTLRRRITAALRHYHTEPWPAAPSCPSQVVLLADAIVKRIRRHWWTVYFTAVKVPGDAAARLLAPIVLPHRESHAGWRVALNALPDDVYSTIKAIICDGHRGLVHYAQGSGWHVQRCQAHLLFAISGRRSRSPWSRHRAEGQRMYDLAKYIFVVTEPAALATAINTIEAMGWETKSRQLRRIISGFVNAVEDYRTYLKHPELDIPTTNNALESFISQFQELCHRARGFATIHSLTSWVSAFSKYKNHITCNGFYQPN